MTTPVAHSWKVKDGQATCSCGWASHPHLWATDVMADLRLHLNSVAAGPGAQSPVPDSSATRAGLGR